MNCSVVRLYAAIFLKILRKLLFIFVTSMLLFVPIGLLWLTNPTVRSSKQVYIPGPIHLNVEIVMPENDTNIRGNVQIINGMRIKPTSMQDEYLGNLSKDELDGPEVQTRSRPTVAEGDIKDTSALKARWKHLLEVENHWHHSSTSADLHWHHHMDAEHRYRAREQRILFKAKKRARTNRGPIQMLQAKAPTSPVIHILFWSSKEANSSNEVMAARCPDRTQPPKCIFTDDQSLYSQSEAVLISLIQIAHGVVKDVPGIRYSFQKWIYMETEAPPQVWYKHRWRDPDRYRQYAHIFNLTALFVPDADIQTHQMARQCVIDETKLAELQKSNVNYAKGKTKKIAWFVSHCITQSKREEYVAELRKYIQVDVFGSCGNYSCGDRYHRMLCDSIVLDKYYKFYLSLENGICDGYVTEKLHRLTVAPISTIPIVLGGTNYTADYPNNTIVNVMDFDSPKSLAAFINAIDKNDTLFNAYITRKKSLSCHRDLQIPYQCRLCEYLHKYRNDVKVAPDVTKFWSVEKRCSAPQDVIKGVNFSPVDYTFPINGADK